MKKFKEEYAFAYLMIAPTIIGLIILNLWPMIQTLYLSFNSTGDFGNNQWVGLDNYKNMLTDQSVIHATINTFKLYNSLCSCRYNPFFNCCSIT